jgi:hypothetical protein
MFYASLEFDSYHLTLFQRHYFHTNSTLCFVVSRSELLGYLLFQCPKMKWKDRSAMKWKDHTPEFISHL